MQAGKCAGVEVGRLGGEEVGRWVGAFACQHVYYTCTTNMSYLLFLCISVLCTWSLVILIKQWFGLYGPGGHANL